MRREEALSVQRILVQAWLTGVVLLLAGCGDGLSRAQVMGTVTLDGEPVQNGVISFTPIGSTRGPSTSTTIKDGHYDLGRHEGPIVGTNRVEALVYRKTGKKIRDVMAEEGFIDEVVQAAPAMYNSQSTLVSTVEPGVNTLDFDLVTEH